MANTLITHNQSMTASALAARNQSKSLLTADFAHLEQLVIQQLLRPIPPTPTHMTSIKWLAGYSFLRGGGKSIYQGADFGRNVLPKKGSYVLLVPTGWLFMLTTEFDYRTEEVTLNLSKVWFHTKSEKNQFYYLLLHYGADPSTIKGFNK